MVGKICYGLDEPTVFDGFSLQVNKIKCYMADTGLLLTLAAGEKYLQSELYKSFILGKLAVNKGMMVENLVSQMFFANSHDLRFYEVYLEENNKKKKYEVDFLIKQNGKTTPIEVKSGKDYQIHSALSNVVDNRNYGVDKAIVFSNSNISIDGKIVYYPIYMVMFIDEDF